MLKGWKNYRLCLLIIGSTYWEVKPLVILQFFEKYILFQLSHCYLSPASINDKGQISNDIRKEEIQIMYINDWFNLHLSERWRPLCIFSSKYLQFNKGFYSFLLVILQFFEKIYFIPAFPLTSLTNIYKLHRPNI